MLLFHFTEPAPPSGEDFCDIRYPIATRSERSTHKYGRRNTGAYRKGHLTVYRLSPGRETVLLADVFGSARLAQTDFLVFPIHSMFFFSSISRLLRQPCSLASMFFFFFSFRFTHRGRSALRNVPDPPPPPPPTSAARTSTRSRAFFFAHVSRLQIGHRTAHLKGFSPSIPPDAVRRKFS